MPDHSPTNAIVTRTVVADDHPIFRCAARDLIERSGAFRVVAEAGSGHEAVDLTLALTHVCQLKRVFGRDGSISH